MTTRPESPAIVVDPYEAPTAQLHDTPALARQLADEARTEAPVDDVFTAAFLEHHAGVLELVELFARAGLPPAGPVDRDLLKALGDGTLDAVVRGQTRFQSWDEFEEAATRSYVARKLLDFVL